MMRSEMPVLGAGIVFLAMIMLTVSPVAAYQFRIGDVPEVVEFPVSMPGVEITGEGLYITSPTGYYDGIERVKILSGVGNASVAVEYDDGSGLMWDSLLPGSHLYVSGNNLSIGSLKTQGPLVVDLLMLDGGVKLNSFN